AKTLGTSEKRQAMECGGRAQRRRRFGFLKIFWPRQSKAESRYACLRTPHEFFISLLEDLWHVLSLNPRPPHCFNKSPALRHILLTRNTLKPAARVNRIRLHSLNR